ncbi:RNA helicase aquarius [Neodiprion pinetum]|uniref:RNA helicase aquarius n=1 Tax=Neodiprion pinetum TaxID=441929 RepID=UPI001EDFC03F|nr:RNA helicase aquarius isoform X1 [Neodiprion pinetum]XP_046491998.1 RNA helicase aquarius isoform X1 [Neodiprion pinetum]XP_046491999.1 RNA helicase aquarius isoform X1 [Neodiprion pinetum]XP_046492000.1 RNA helicase aquarius isoform X1 [Neodiprion pinetum]
MENPAVSLLVKTNNPAPTVDQINADRITQLANKYWAPHTTNSHLQFDPVIIEDIYIQEICASKFSIRRIMMLEFSQYLENYLWPNYSTGETSHSHMMSIVVMLNEKFRERVQVWEAFSKNPQHFPGFFQQVLEACLNESTMDFDLKEQTALIVFLNHCFNSMEVALVRNEVKRLVSLSMWVSLQQGRREFEFRKFPKWRKYWKIIQKKDKPEIRQKLDWERRFLQRLMVKFMTILETVPLEGAIFPDKIHYCERFLELVIDLEALLPTRRFFNTVMDDSHLVVRCQLSNLVQRPEGGLFNQLLEMLKFYARFEISEETGDPLTDHDMTQLHYTKITSLQKAAFAKFPDLRSFALANVASVDTREALYRHFGTLSQEKLRSIATYLNLVPPEEREVDENWYRLDLGFLRELLISRHERRASQLEELNEMPLYPTEEVVWNESIVPTEYFSGEGCLALPKLNLQFLTLHDYLLRNFNLFRLESTYEIRQDIEDSVSRLSPWRAEDGGVYYGGWARMAQPITQFAVVEVAKPNIGENRPSRVRADVTVNLSVRKEIKAEWENLRKHDVCFLISIKPPNTIGTKYSHKLPFVPQVGLTTVRGCEIEGMLDSNGRVIEDGPEPRPVLPGENRTYRVWLDSNQYRIDMDNASHGREDVYEGFNIIMRRKPKENNFKAVLETIRELMNTECVVPDWLHNIILGYGDPGAAQYARMPDEIAVMDFNDTFLDIDHLRASFPGYEIKVEITEEEKLVRPFRLTFEEVLCKQNNQSDRKVIMVEPHVPPSRGPYKANEPKRNQIPFTPTQVEAIRAGMQPGLTLVVGPPGTGKTDVAVQIISNLYHNFPNQRTLIVTHSNQALNQLFEKIMALDIDERHLLRLGHGEEALETEKDFSRYGRVNYVLAKRLDLLMEVQRLQESLNVKGDVAYTCETAGHFFMYQILTRWERFNGRIKQRSGSNPSPNMVSQEFPFHKFFDNAPQPLFKERSYSEDMEIAQGCFRYVERMFAQLEEFRAFELLRSGLDRSKYLLVKEAKVIAMTCTHAALKRRELVDMGFKYDNILMEESAQILEIETFIPLLLQNPQDGYNRLKRWIMIGDHHQLPPVIKNMAFQKYSNMEQSLFARFVRLGVPTVDLDGQGRARPSICNLYNWRYKKLGNLCHVERSPEYLIANAGFLFDFQLINVEDFNGVGESEPSAYFYQNLAEAEYCVAVFMYMRLLGYPADKISILTTYNGQKHLIRDVINIRCANNPLIGRPNKVTTVDKYQGQQNDYILLSLVKTRAVGHLRDVRRLVVAMSRARLGLYVFARVALFKNCFELTPAFDQLMQRPLKLHILPSEMYPAQRLNESLAASVNLLPEAVVIKDMPHMAKFVYDYYMDKVSTMKAQTHGAKQWQEPGTTGRIASPTHHISAHPGADDDTDDEDEQARIQLSDDCADEKKLSGDVEKPKPIQNLLEESTDDHSSASHEK